jgi:acyl-coenzyme A thioesterase PaaI-like protein
MPEHTQPPVEVSPEAFLSMGRSVLAAQPFSALLGAELHGAQRRAGASWGVPTVTDKLRQQHGFVHGGVLSYAADNALTFAGGTALRVPVLTSRVQDQLRAPCHWGAARWRAPSAVHRGKSQAVCRCDVFVVKDGVEKLCARGAGHDHRTA